MCGFFPFLYRLTPLGFLLLYLHVYLFTSNTWYAEQVDTKLLFWILPFTVWISHNIYAMLMYVLLISHLVCTIADPISVVPCKIWLKDIPLPKCSILYFCLYICFYKAPRLTSFNEPLGKTKTWKYSKWYWLFIGFRRLLTWHAFGFCFISLFSFHCRLIWQCTVICKLASSLWLNHFKI